MDLDRHSAREFSSAGAHRPTSLPRRVDDAARLAQHYGPVLRRAKLRFTERGLDAADVEDAVGDVFLALLRRAWFVDDATWLIAAVSNRCRSLCAARARRVRVSSAALESASDPHAECEREQPLRASLEGALGKLDDFQRAVIVAHFFDGVSLLGIARREAATRKRVRWAFERAIHRLRVELSASANVLEVESIPRSWSSALLAARHASVAKLVDNAAK